ncbi:hypothetical protein D9M71_711150 [compost metagenome]
MALQFAHQEIDQFHRDILQAQQLCGLWVGVGTHHIQQGAQEGRVVLGQIQGAVVIAHLAAAQFVDDLLHLLNQLVPLFAQRLEQLVKAFGQLAIQHRVFIGMFAHMRANGVLHLRGLGAVVDAAR